MKKRVIIVTLLLIFSIGICLYELYNINNISKESIENLKTMQMYVEQEDIESAQTLSEQTKELWDKNNVMLTIFMQHQYVEDILQTLNVMDTALNIEETSDFFTENTRAILQISKFSHTEFPKIENIL